MNKFTAGGILLVLVLIFVFMPGGGISIYQRAVAPDPELGQIEISIEMVRGQLAAYERHLEQYRGDPGMGEVADQLEGEIEKLKAQLAELERRKAEIE